MLFHRSFICLLNCSSGLFVRYIWKEMAFCSYHAFTCIRMSWSSYIIYLDWVICVHVSPWGIVSRKNDNRIEFCLWILNLKVDHLDLASWLGYSRIHSDFYSSLFSSHFQKNIIYRTCSFIFCNISDYINLCFVSWITKI